MRIVVNTRLLLKNKLDGIGWFSYETLKRITQSHPEVEFIFVFDRIWDNEFIFGENVTPVHIGPPSRHPFLWYWWFENSLPRILNRYQPDLFLSPDGYLTLKTHIPSLPVIHDINFEHFPLDLPFWYRTYYRHYFPKFAEKSTRIATVSDFSKNDIIEKYGVSPEKIDVLYNGVSDRFRPIVSKQKTEIQNEHSDGSPFFVFVGTLHPRKNIARIMEAFEGFKNSGNYPHKLVFVGKRKWWTRQMESTFNNLKNKSDILFIEDASSKNVSDLVASSEALLYPSTFEGFGIPILEGMKSGVPVITSNCTAMPETAEDAALLCNPFDTSSITEQMKRLVHEPGLSESLVSSGLKRAENFSWERTAELLWGSIVKASN